MGEIFLHKATSEWTLLREQECRSPVLLVREECQQSGNPVPCPLQGSAMCQLVRLDTFFFFF